MFPGDIIVGDSEGVVVIPPHLAETVAESAKVMEDREDFIVERIRSGASIIGNYPPDEKTLSEFEEWKRNR